MLRTIRNSPLFDGVGERTLEKIAESSVREDWAKGHQIMGPSDSMANFRLVLQGRVKIVRSNYRDGRELTLWLLGPGEGFDIACLLDGRPHEVTAWAADPVSTFAAPMAVWFKWLQLDPRLVGATHRFMAAKLRELTELAGDLALHDTGTRLSHLLLRHFGGSSPNLLEALPQRELAAKIGSVRIVVSRVLAQMKAQGVVQMHGGAVRAVDLKRLLEWTESNSEHPLALTDAPKSLKR